MFPVFICPVVGYQLYLTKRKATNLNRVTRFQDFMFPGRFFEQRDELLRDDLTDLAVVGILDAVLLLVEGVTRHVTH